MRNAWKWEGLNPSQICKNCVRIKQFMKDVGERLEQLTGINKEQRQKIELLEKKLETLESKKLGRELVENKVSKLEEKVESLLVDATSDIAVEAGTISKGHAWTEIVKKRVDAKFKKIEDRVQVVDKKITMAKTIAQEEVEREKRRNNIILYRLEESKSKCEQEQKTDDRNTAMHFINNILGVKCDNGDIKSVFRLGKDTKEVRPLMIQFRERELKNLVLESLPKLRTAESKFKCISVCHDLTRAERDMCKKLLEEAKKKQAEDQSGDYIFRVKGHPGSMRLEKLRKRSHEKLDAKMQASKQEEKEVIC